MVTARAPAAAALAGALLFALVAHCAVQFPAPIPEALPPAGQRLSVNPLTAQPGAIAGRPPTVPIYGSGTAASFKEAVFTFSVGAAGGAPAAERAVLPNVPAAEYEFTRGPVRTVAAPLPPTALPISGRPAGSVGGDPGPTILYPWSPVGLLNVTFPGGQGGSKACTGALVAPGVVLTAARSLLPYGGAKTGAAYPAAVEFTPALYDKAGNGVVDGNDAPFGTWPARANAAGDGPAVFVPRAWAEGTDVCAPGKLPDGQPTACQNDLAVLLTTADKKNINVGAYTGYLGLGFSFFGASDFPPGVQNALSWQITSLGYPAGLKMTRSDGLATWVPGSIAAVRGPAAAAASGERQATRATGAIGAPWIFDFGSPEGGATDGGSPAPTNLVVGLTSFEEPSYSGSSLFGVNDAPEARSRPNVVALLEAACGSVPPAQRDAVCADRVAIPI